jgi:predicted acyltransferase
MSDSTLAQTATRIHDIEVSAVAPPASARLLSLDVFRGITIAAMLLVNNPGTWSAVYPPLRHAEWHGWTPTDLIFPFFLFIVGVAMAFSFGKLIEQGADRGTLLWKSAKRAAILFGLGLLMHSYPWVGYDWSTLRIPGVLQRIALAFLAASVVVLWTGQRGRIVTAAALLLGYWAVMTLVPLSGGAAGVLEPGQDLGAYVDRAVFGTEHLWASSRTWDPEGLLSTLPAVGTVLLGVLAGGWLRSRRPSTEIVRGLVVAGTIGVALGLLWDAVFPINKALWTSSFVMLTAGLGALGLALCYWLVDVKGYRKWAFPFVVFGVNAIAAYFLSGLMARQLDMTRVGADGAETSLKGWIFQNVFASWLSPVNASLAFGVSFVLFWMGVMWLFYRRKIFIKV